MTEGIDERVSRFLRSLEAFDFAAAREMCTESATVRQNDGRGDQPIKESLDQLELLAAELDVLDYDILRRFRDPGEVLQQHVLHLVGKDGSRRDVHAVVHFRFLGGLIDRIEECVYPEPGVTRPSTPDTP
ncbi:nuclear transport factor 2 family protein [Streptomyces cyaneofuscatus]|uniref:nuclear transport factor 2 family protein n=1 Tax=Streptomyces cyaneofuscatus TaxID=66883 RepID=UPI0033AE5F33